MAGAVLVIVGYISVYSATRGVYVSMVGGLMIIYLAGRSRIRLKGLIALGTLGLAGLKYLSQAVTDLDAAIDWYVDIAGATVAYREPRPAAGAVAAGLHLGIEIVELLAPVEDGAISAYLDHYGPRIRATTFTVRDLDAVERYFAERDIAVVPGDAPDSLAIPAEENLGLLYQFAE